MMLFIPSGLAFNVLADALGLKHVDVNRSFRLPADQGMMRLWECPTRLMNMTSLVNVTGLESDELK